MTGSPLKVNWSRVSSGFLNFVDGDRLFEAKVPAPAIPSAGVRWHSLRVNHHSDAGRVRQRKAEPNGRCHGTDALAARIMPRSAWLEVHFANDRQAELLGRSGEEWRWNLF